MNGVGQEEIERVLISKEELQERVAELAQKISADFAGRDLVLIGVLKGSFCFLADLMRALTIPVRIDFVACSSYGAGSESVGNLSITKDVSGVVFGKELLIVEDIVDTGLTLKELKRFLESKQPKGVYLATLLDKPERRRDDCLDLVIDYSGFSIPNDFVVGYGLDYDERWRQLDYIGTLKPEVYQKL